MGGKENGGKPDEGDKRRDAPADANPGKRKGRDDQVSRVLKTVYDDTLREDVPDEFEDLLRKLG